MVTRSAFMALIALLSVTACGQDEDAIRFDGQVFSSRLKSERGDRARFVVTARPVSASLAGAREAARYEATSYCVNEYGSSDIDWQVSPDAEEAELPIEGDTLTLQGECPE